MARQQKDPKREVQVLVRLTGPENELLDSLAHLESTTVANLLYRLAQAEAARAEANEFVAADLANKRAFAASKSSEVVDLSVRRRGAKR